MDLKKFTRYADSYLEAHVDDMNSLHPLQEGKPRCTEGVSTSEFREQTVVKASDEMKPRSFSSYLCSSSQHRMEDCTK